MSCAELDELDDRNGRECKTDSDSVLFPADRNESEEVAEEGDLDKCGGENKRYEH